MAFVIFTLYGIILIFLQIFLLRELIPIFHGNEFVVGIIIFHWLFAVGVLNYIYPRIKKSKNTAVSIIKLLFVLIAFIIFSFLFIRSINLINVTDITRGVSLKTAFLYSFIAIFPVSFISNLVLNYFKIYISSIVYKKKIKRYIYEAFGFVIGGVLFSCFMSSLSTSMIISIIICLICVNFIFLFRAAANKAAVLLIMAVIMILTVKFDKDIEKISILNNYGGNDIIDVSYFGNQQNILTEKNGEFYFYSNGTNDFSLPSQNIFEDEDFAHLPILHHEDPKNILLIGGVKYLSSIVKYDFIEIDYIESNKKIVDVISRHIPKLENVFKDKRLKIYNDDARNFLLNNSAKYDVILIGLDLPINTEINKFYTEEFFKIAVDKLTDDGFMALKLPGSMVYSPSLMAELNSSVYNSLKNVFQYVQIIPGKENIFIASKSHMPFRKDIKRRLKNVQDETFVLSKYYVDERMDTQKTQWLDSQIKEERNLNLVNTDENQKAVIFSIMYWQSTFSPYLMKFFRVVTEYSYFLVFIAVILFFFIKFKYTVTAFVSGASAMWLQMVCFWAFQIYVGQIYQWFGLLTSIFMAGLIAGALYSKYSHKAVALNKTFFSSEILYLLWIIAYIIIVRYHVLNVYSLVVLSLGTGFITGLEFAQLIKIFAIMKEGDSNTQIFSSDAFGGCFASCAGGAFIIPVWGIEKSLLFILFLKFLIFTWWHYHKKHGL
ncbi:MAG: hypothetical protein VB017_06550 [Endomicrobiaceae bacterium]|nr:hypothetical protein [Endomicrobiaceae bacterium]